MKSYGIWVYRIMRKAFEAQQYPGAQILTSKSSQFNCVRDGILCLVTTQPKWKTDHHKGHLR